MGIPEDYFRAQIELSKPPLDLKILINPGHYL
jgi:hypothetical protein